MRRYKPQTLSASDGLCALFGAELDEDMLDVSFHCLGRDGEVAGNLLVGQALGDHLENRTFARTEGVGEPGSWTCRSSGLIARPPGGDHNGDQKQQKAPRNTTHRCVP